MRFSHLSRDFTYTRFSDFFPADLVALYIRLSVQGDVSLISKESVNRSIRFMFGPKRNDKFGFSSLAVSRDKVVETSKLEGKQNLLFFLED